MLISRIAAQLGHTCMLFLYEESNGIITFEFRLLNDQSQVHLDFEGLYLLSQQS